MISNVEAIDALRDAQATELRSRQAYGYSLSAPYCFIQGIVWIVGYAAQASNTSHDASIWTAALLAGAIACVLVGISQTRRGARNVRRVWLFIGVLYAFSFALFAIFSPVRPIQMAAYWPLLGAGVCCGIGLWLGIRYVIVGAVLGALTLASFFYFRDYFFITMAILGGGALILTGFWLRKA